MLRCVKHIPKKKPFAKTQLFIRTSAHPCRSLSAHIFGAYRHRGLSSHMGFSLLISGAATFQIDFPRCTIIFQDLKYSGVLTFQVASRFQNMSAQTVLRFHSHPKSSQKYPIFRNWWDSPNIFKIFKKLLRCHHVACPLFFFKPIVKGDCFWPIQHIISNFSAPTLSKNNNNFWFPTCWDVYK